MLSHRNITCIINEQFDNRGICLARCFWCFCKLFVKMASEGFVKASSNNMPSVDIFMVTEFIKNDERFNAAEVRGAKAAA